MARREDSGGFRGQPSVERFFQFALLGLVAAGYLAVAGSGYLDAPTIALTGAGLLLRALVVGGLFRLDLTGRAASWIALGYAAFFPVDYFLLSRDLLSSTVHLVFFLAVVRIVTAKTNRDYLAVAVIAFLELVAAALLSIDFNFFLFLTLYLFFAIAALTSGEIRRAMLQAPSLARGGLRRFHPRLAALTVWIALGILALTAGMFFLLPRTADAALSRLTSHRVIVPGFSSRVTLGEIGQFKTTSRAIMHIAVYYATRAVGGLKWRGGVLTYFDGRAWSDPDRTLSILHARDGRFDLLPPGRYPGAAIGYRVELAALDSPALFFAGIPEHVDGLPSLMIETQAGSLRLERMPPEGIRYEAYGVVEDPPESAPVVDPSPVLDPDRRKESLQLPPALDPRIAALARTMADGASTDLEKTRAVEQHLSHDYGYTLQLPDRVPSDPLAEFLFVRRKGHCEYFASAMAVMLRTLGIPARLAVGFQSGVYNPISEMWLVRASDAHSWVEAWIPGHGWTTFDPTPPDTQTHALGLSSKLGLYLDAAQTFWQRWVMGYDPSRQGTLTDRVEQTASRLGIRWFDSLSGVETDWVTRVRAWFRRFGLRLAAALASGVGLWLLTPGLFGLLRLRRRVERVRRGQASVADATLLYQRMLHVLKRRGYQKPDWFTPVEFARSLPGTRMAAAVAEFTAAYNAVRFGGHTEAAPRLSALLDELEHGRD